MIIILGEGYDMKKFLSLSIVLSLMCMLIACGKTEPSTPAQHLLEDFKSIVKADSSITVEDLAQKLAENENVPIECGSMTVEPGYLNGFTSEVDGFTAGAMFSPYIGTIPYVGYVFETDGDGDKLVEQLKDKHDLRWNVCTEADEMICESVGNRVFFVMAPLSFDE